MKRESRRGEAAPAGKRRGRGPRLLRRLFPDCLVDSVYEIDYDRLYRSGVRAVLYDIDNTLVLHDEPATEEAKRLFRRIHGAGLRIALLSNNQEKRVGSFARECGADLYFCDAHKPSPKAYRRAEAELGLPGRALFFFGDQLFTDIWGARNAGIPNALVRPRGREKYFHIRLKRLLERPILFLYRHFGEYREGIRTEEDGARK